jgi:hypothetical protein
LIESWIKDLGIGFRFKKFIKTNQLLDLGREFKIVIYSLLEPLIRFLRRSQPTFQIFTEDFLDLFENLVDFLVLDEEAFLLGAIGRCQKQVVLRLNLMTSPTQNILKRILHIEEGLLFRKHLRLKVSFRNEYFGWQGVVDHVLLVVVYEFDGV